MSTTPTLEAERAAPGITDAEIAGIMGWRGPGAYTEATLRKIRRVLEVDQSRRTAAPVAEDVALPHLDAQGLPPLSKAEALGTTFGGGDFVYGYTAEQVRQAQRDTDLEARQKVAVALGLGRVLGGSFAWEYLLGIIDGRTAGTAPTDLSNVARVVIAHMETQSSPPHAPGHCHEIPGVWDQSNEPAIAGKPCKWCATWSRFKSLAAAPSPLSPKEEAK